MKSLNLFLVLSILLVGCAGGGDSTAEYNALIRQADSLYMAADYAAASVSFDNAFKVKKSIQDTHLYNGACVAALAGDADKAFARLGMRMK